MTQRLTYELIRELVKEELEGLQLEQKKKTCTSRKDGKGMNRFHNADGEFSSKADAKSSSIRNPTSKDCKFAGQGRENPHRFTRIKCGRKDASDPDQKAKYRCKDGSRVTEAEEEEIKLLDEPTYPKELKQLGQGMTEDQISRATIGEKPDWRTKYQQFVNSLTPEEQRQVKSTICSYNPNTMAKLINQFAKALDGKLDEPSK
jgi:hypothetical protein